ncbi:MAG: hypothetical protein FJW40_08925 [Acidobacteria bacterium]|nr:hypothetical protein [Acidobacteriota bacterium]
MAQPRIGAIDFFGVRGVGEDKLRKALGVREGDPLPPSKSDLEEKLEEVKGVVRANIAAVCCAASGGPILYVGIEERLARHADFRQEPPGNPIELPREILDTHDRFLEAVAEAAEAGDTTEDLSRGYSLMRFQAAREQQLKFLELAAAHGAELKKVIRESSDSRQRAIAALVLPYAPRKLNAQDDLQYALRDSDDTVRTNAMRSLIAVAELARRDVSLGLRVQPTWMIELLWSLAWTDRDRAARNLLDLTEHREPTLLTQLVERAAQPLADMARWKHLPHALPAFILLGRAMNYSEEAIHDLWNRGEREILIQAAEKKGKRAPGLPMPNVRP